MVCWGKTVPLTVPLSIQVYKRELANCFEINMLGGNLRRTSIPSRGSRNTPSRFILQKLEISGGTDEPFGSPNYDLDIFTGVHITLGQSPSKPVWGGSGNKMLHNSLVKLAYQLYRGKIGDASLTLFLSFPWWFLASKSSLWQKQHLNPFTPVLAAPNAKLGKLQTG